MELEPYTINEAHLRRVIRGDVNTTKRVYAQWRDCSTGRWGNRKRLLCKVPSDAAGYATAAENIQHWLDSE